MYTLGVPVSMCLCSIPFVHICMYVCFLDLFSQGLSAKAYCAYPQGCVGYHGGLL